MRAMYNNLKIQKTLEDRYKTKYLLYAQEIELRKIEKIILEVERRLGRPISVLDLGVGDGRVPLHLSKLRKLWDKIKGYDGIDNSAVCVRISKKAMKININKISKIVNIILLDANEMSKLGKKYDLILCTFFTAGNFVHPEFSFENYLLI